MNGIRWGKKNKGDKKYWIVDDKKKVFKFKWWKKEYKWWNKEYFSQYNNVFIMF